MKKPRKFPPVGKYTAFIYEKNVNESFIEGLKRGDVFWTVTVAKDQYLDCRDQWQAEMIARLVRIENLLKKKGAGKKQ